MICGSEIRRKIQQSKMKRILDNGELFMFDAKLTKLEHEKIKQNFEKMLEENDQKTVEVKQEKNCDNFDDIEKLINLKNNLSN